jgi:hypothetical protein
MIAKEKRDAQEADERVVRLVGCGERHREEACARDGAEVDDPVVPERARERLLRRTRPVDRIPARRAEQEHLKSTRRTPDGDEHRRRARADAHVYERVPLKPGYREDML